MKIFSTGWSENFDGPGRRRIIYLKGCNFKCLWCANPEGLSHNTEILFYSRRAQYANKACPNSAVTKQGNEYLLNHNICENCASKNCVNSWKHPAFEIAGEELSVDSLVKYSVDNKQLFGAAGGITFSGGEPTLQIDEIITAINMLHKDGITTTVESNAGTENFARLIGTADLLICDLKCVSTDLHKHWTGQDNSLVLNNLRSAAKEQKNLWIRIPLIPGMNDTKEELTQTAEFLQEVAAHRDFLKVEILRMHHIGEPKYKALSMKYQLSDIKEPSREHALHCIDLLKHKKLLISLAQ
ncbi:MAG: glycyl-radical enzyme activating protein [Planctomycetota bacterium]